MKRNYRQTSLEDDNDSLNLKTELEKYLRHWQWFF